MFSADIRRALKKPQDRSFIVDLDVEKGQTPRPPREGQKARENKHRVAIKFAKRIQLATVRAYVEGKTDFDNGVLEGISKIAWPSSAGHC